MYEDNFHREWRPDWKEIEEPINNDRREDECV